MVKKIIMLNGAPSSGKDTIAKLFSEKFGFHHMEIKAELFNIALKLSGIRPTIWYDRYNDRENNLKEKPWDRLGGLSQREFLIRISEDWMKPVFGSDVFGVKAANAVKYETSPNGNAIFSDSGFQVELDAMVREFGEDNVLLVRLHRNGYSFDGDSRGYLTHKHEIDIHNNVYSRQTADEILQYYTKNIA